MPATAKVTPSAAQYRETLLQGYSGAQLALHNDSSGRWFVRKTAVDEASSARLRGQAEKQRRLAAALGGVIRLPEVLMEGEDGGRYFFEMEFVNATDGVTFLARAPFPDVKAFADSICRYLRAAASAPALLPGCGLSLFEANYVKVCDVAESTGAIDPALLSDLFLVLNRTVRKMPSPAPTLCHGDFTLENLLVDGSGAIWLVDALDAPVETFWQDVAKLHQDLEGEWYRRRHAPISKAVLDYISARVRAAVAEISPPYQGCHYTLLAMNFVRILPYTRSEAERDFVLGRIRHFVSIAAESPSSS
jgi:aminoglycoside phosphotransferase